MTKLLISLIAISVAISGCSFLNTGDSADFACPGMPSGVSCKTPREVYRLSNKDKNTKTTGKADMPTYLFATEPGKSGTLNPVPVLEQAKVMRVWIAPWIDKNNDQHWPGLVFTVIQPKQWHFGNQEFDGVEPPIPHRMLDQTIQPKSPPSADQANSSVVIPKHDEVLN